MYGICLYKYMHTKEDTVWKKQKGKAGRHKDLKFGREREKKVDGKKCGSCEKKQVGKEEMDVEEKS